MYTNSRDTKDFEGYEVAMFRAYLEKDIRVDPESFRGRKRMKRCAYFCFLTLRKYDILFLLNLH